MVKHGVRWVATVGLLLSAGCSSEPVATNDAGTVGVGAEDYYIRLMDAFCEGAFRCSTPVFYGLAMIDEAADEAACKRYARTLNAQVVARTAARLRAGAVAYNAADGEACIATARANCAGRRLFDEGPCTRAIVGTGTIGHACTDNTDCGLGLYCTQEAGAACGGRCQRASLPGEACDSPMACNGVGARSALCMGGTCMATVDAPLVAEGGMCGVSTTGQTTTRYACADGLVCVQAVCHRAATGDEDCTQHGRLCRAGTTCASPENRCRPVSQRIAVREGDACMTTSMGELPRCNMLERLQCTSGRCQRIGDGTAGSACNVNNSASTCNAGLACNPSDQRCAPLLAEGAACAQHIQCTSGRCMDGRCMPVFCP